MQTELSNLTSFRLYQEILECDGFIYAAAFFSNVSETIL